jgi:hypothetical protein
MGAYVWFAGAALLAVLIWRALLSWSGIDNPDPTRLVLLFAAVFFATVWLRVQFDELARKVFERSSKARIFKEWTTKHKRALRIAGFVFGGAFVVYACATILDFGELRDWSLRDRAIMAVVLIGALAFESLRENRSK